MNVVTYVREEGSGGWGGERRGVTHELPLGLQPACEMGVGRWVGGRVGRRVRGGEGGRDPFIYI